MAKLQGPFAMEQLQRVQQAEVPTPGATGKPMSIEELMRQQMGQVDNSPTPMNTEFARGYAPGGPQLNFTGGSPFPVDETPATIHNGLLLAKEVARIIGEIKKKKATAKGEKTAAAGSPK
jgi:hypothetical protein